MAKRIKAHAADILFCLGSAAASAGGFFISVPAGLFIAGGSMLAGALIIGRAEYISKGRGSR